MQAKPTAATYTLRDPVAVSQFLSQLVAWGHTSANDWQSCGGCNGWDLDRSAVASQDTTPALPFAATGPKANGLPDGWRHAPSGYTISETVHGLATRSGSSNQWENGDASPSSDVDASQHRMSEKSQQEQQQQAASSRQNGNAAAASHEGFQNHEGSQKQQPAQQMHEAQEALRSQLQLGDKGSGKLRSKSGDGQKRRPDWKWDQPLDTWYSSRAPDSSQGL